jgi:hypothetical protein
MTLFQRWAIGVDHIYVQRNGRRNDRLGDDCMSRIRQWSTGRFATAAALAFTTVALGAPKKW